MIFLIYQERTTEVKEIYHKFGASAAVVMQLSERITTPNHLLSFDNYFSNCPLLQLQQYSYL